MDVLSRRVSSITTGGARGLVRRCRGSTSTSPMLVANRSLPSRVLHPVACSPPLKSVVNNPSAVPYEIDGILLILPAAKSFKSLLRERNKPRFELIHRLPESSSTMLQMESSKSPSLLLKLVNFPSCKRMRPEPYVPIQNTWWASS